ncbi:MAG: prepilin peptidase [Cyanobacteria bacterium K_Offshore_surface_m2_239]|nr:prepilin peptidase [Cyanobacteria bacterium K_Offshore_surface_m2_239]
MLPTPLVVPSLSLPWPGAEPILVAALLGACVGSFLNVVVWRIPREESVLWPSSHCPRCGTPLSWLENIPVLSWVGLRGRCCHCQAPISRRYPLTELLCAGLWVLMTMARPDGLGPRPAGLLVVIAGWLLVSLLLVLALIDGDQLWIPEPICRWGVVAGWLVTASVGWQQSAALGREVLGSHLLAAALGLIGFDLLSALGTRWLGRPAMGSGDGKVAALLGAWLGLAGLALAAFAAILLAAVVGGLALATGAIRRQQPVPFVPFLATGGALLWVTGTTPWLRLVLGQV